MRKLKSGVYFVKFKDIKTFLKEVEKNGWKHTLDKPQKKVYEILTAFGEDVETIKQSVIPFALNQERSSVGYWVTGACAESEVEETMRTWRNWRWSARHIEFYKSEKIIL